VPTYVSSSDLSLKNLNQQIMLWLGPLADLVNSYSSNPFNVTGVQISLKVIQSEFTHKLNGLEH